MRTFSQLVVFGTASALLSVAPAYAQTCRASVGGSYSFSSLGNGLSASDDTNHNNNNNGNGNGNGTGNNTNNNSQQPTYSDTEVGRLLKGIGNTGAFTGTGTLTLENGIITADANSMNMTNVQVGTYTVNSDCTVMMTLVDTFGRPNVLIPGQPLNTSTGTTLHGVVLRNGGEIVLGWFPNAPNMNNQNGNSGNNGDDDDNDDDQQQADRYQSSAIVRLTRTLPGTCSASSLSGTYGLVIQGFGSHRSADDDDDNSNGNGEGNNNDGDDSSMQTPYFIIATVTFDGSGRVTPASQLPNSPLSYLRYSGTYTVNADCTGTMTLTGMAPMNNDNNGNGNGNGNGNNNNNGNNNTANGTTTQAMTFSFVLRRPVAEVNASGQAPGAGQARPVLQITSSSNGMTLIGEGYSTEQ